MRLSANQLYAELKKAFCGAGYDFASADDIAQAGQFMAQLGHDISDEVSASLAAGYGLATSPHKAGDGWQLPLDASLVDMLAGRDFYLSDDSLTLHCEALNYPLLSHGLMALAQSPYFGSFATADAQPLTTICQGHDKTIPQTLMLRKIAFHPGAALSMPVRVVVSDSCYELVSHYAYKTYVPSSEASRAAGAGAGLTDND